MNIEYTLHKLEKGFVITSDEKPQTNDLVYDSYDLLIYKLESFTSTNIHQKKLIAQQEQITFSDDVSKEKLIEIGYFDVEKLAWKAVKEGNAKNRNEELWAFTGWIDGFETAQELLSDKQFTVAELINNFKPAFDKFINDGGAIGSSENWIQWQNVVEWFPRFLQSLQPTQWKIEGEFTSCLQDIGVCYEKCIGKCKFKITKIL